MQKIKKENKNMIIQFEFETSKTPEQYLETFGPQNTLSLSDICEILAKDTAALGKSVNIFTNKGPIINK